MTIKCMVKYVIKPHKKCAIRKTTASVCSVISMLYRGKIFKTNFSKSEMFSKQIQNLTSLARWFHEK